jgi:hypothetical protein
MVEEAVVGSIMKYLASRRGFGIHASKAVLFGSFARGDASDLSDIDLVVIAPQFDGPRDVSLVKSLWRATVCDNRIEPLPCGEPNGRRMAVGLFLKSLVAKAS